MIHSVEFPHPLLLLIGICLGIGSAWLLLRRREAIGISPAIWVGAGVVCAAFAASSVRVVVPSSEPVQVIVDLSESTRIAGFRDEDSLKRRIAELLAGRPYQVVAFDGQTLRNGGGGPALLFSDGQFASRIGTGPIFPVMDDSLSAAADARVVNIVHERGAAIAIVENSGSARELLRVGAQRIAIPPGRHRLRAGRATEAVTVSLSPGDAWPENDTLSSLPQPAGAAQRWACGISATGAQFTDIAPADIPQHASGFATASVVLLDAGSAAGLSAPQQQAIASWVRNLGGSLVLVGQDVGWAKLRQSAIDEISPLSPDPPAAMREWAIAIDVSGSMSQIQGDEEKWRAAFAAGHRLTRSLPRNDLARVGLFSTDLRWVASGAASGVSLEPPAGFVARGPTNLEAALELVLALPSVAERELVLLTDAEVELRDIDRTVERFRAAGIRVSCLILSEGRGRALLERLCRETGGTAVGEVDAGQWTRRAEELAGRLAPARWQESSIQVSTFDPLPDSMLRIAGWNEAYLREGATSFAGAAGRPLAARWRLGLGHVAAISFPLPEDWAALLADKLEQLPADPAFEVQWLEDSVRINSPAKASLLIQATTPVGSSQRALAPVAPRRYEADLPDLSAGAHVVISDGGRIIARRSFARRYAREFAHIGIDAERLARLARETGGRVIGIGERRPIVELSSPRFVSLATPLGIVSILFIATGMLVLRQRL